MTMSTMGEEMWDTNAQAETVKLQLEGREKRSKKIGRNLNLF